MAGKDLYGYKPQEQEVTPKPKLITLYRNMFPEEAFGYSIFPEILEGRDRPESIFDQPMKSLWKGPPSKAIAELDNKGIKTIAEILNLTQDQFITFGKTEEISYRVGSYLSRQAITPHANLLGAIFRRKQIPVPPNREKEIVDIVEKVILTLGEREQVVLRSRFGLDGQTHSLDETGQNLGGGYNPVTRERARQVEDLALKKLRRPSIARVLEEYLTLPERSFGRWEFGAVIVKDLPPLASGIDMNGLFYSMVQELREQGLLSLLEPGQLRALAAVDLGAIDLFSSYRSVAYEMRQIAKIEQDFQHPSDPQAVDLAETGDKERYKKIIERENIYLDRAYKIIAVTRDFGCQSPRQIQDWLMDNDIRIFNLYPESVKTLALIEYLLNHPQRKEEKIIRSYEPGS